MTRSGKRALIVYVDEATIEALDDMAKLGGLMNVLSEDESTTRSSVARSIIEEHVQGFDRENVAKGLNNIAHSLSKLKPKKRGT
jgi:hypothetical protein